MIPPLVSIIVPIFNVEEFLRECLDSLIGQTHQDFEIILVNDGSSDSSGSICDEYSMRDERVRVYHTKNNGVSHARNFGIREARGKWISFIDSDDWVDHNYLKKLLDADTDNDNELICCGYSMQNSRDIWKSYTPKCTLYEKDNYPLIYHTHLPSEIIRAPWCKIFLRDSIVDQQLFFNEELSFGEDTIFNLQYLSAISKASVIDLKGYYRRYRSSSLARTVNIERWEQFLNIYNKHLRTLFEKYKLAGIKKEWANRCLELYVKKIELIYKGEGSPKKIQLKKALEVLEVESVNYASTTKTLHRKIIAYLFHRFKRQVFVLNYFYLVYFKIRKLFA